MTNRIHPTSDPGALLSTAHELDGGLCVRLRLTRPTDAARVRDFLEGLSEETTQRRFFTSMPTIDERTLRHFTFYNPRERMVIAATMPVGGSEQLVGLADVSHATTGTAELGLLVGDEWQGNGIGSLLADAIATLASRQGVRTLKAEMLESSSAMIGLLRRLGPTVETIEAGNPVAYTRLAAARRSAA